jgi:septal ring factor EnvC (AmiA/AmiB activator)
MMLRVGLIIILIGFSSALVAETEDNDHELSAVRAKIREVGDDVRTLAGDKNTQIEQLKRLEKQYGEQINALKEIKAEIRRKEQALQEVRNNLAAKQKDIQDQQQGLQGLIRSAYSMGDQQRLNVVLNQHDPALSGRMMVYFDYISKARLQKLETIDQDLKSLRQLESQYDTETQLLQVDLEKKQQETDALEVLKQQREKLLAQIDNDYALKHGELAQLIRDEKKLEALVASLQKTDDNEALSAVPQPEIAITHNVKSEQTEKVRPTLPPVKISEPREQAIRSGKAFPELKGQLPWPVQGAINERFGSRRFDITLDGAIIGAHEGADIRAVADGRVVYADWLRGYGLMIIVDHGKGYMSLYAYNQSLHKSVGEQVRAGESLASVGRSGGRSQAALYFGIRAKGRPVDPEQWCRKPEKG